MKAILTDITKCIGCNKCKDACYNLNNKGKVAHPCKDAKDDLSEMNWADIILYDQGRLYVDGRDYPDCPTKITDKNVKDNPNAGYVRKHCLHCLEPTCVAVCPVGAFHKDAETGAVVYDSKKCIGCRYCMYACPFSIPRYEWGTPFPVVQKCILCFDKIKEGQEPACTAACPEKATIFGDRDELIAEAHRRIKDNPEQYLNHVYGETEAGGTSVLYITKPGVPLDLIGFNENLGTQSLPTQTHKWLVKVPPIGVGAAISFSGLFWIINRRNELANGEENVEGGDANEKK